jgi:hypothetical protein
MLKRKMPGGMWQSFSRGVRNAFGNEQLTDTREQPFTVLLRKSGREGETASVKLQVSVRCPAVPPPHPIDADSEAAAPIPRQGYATEPCPPHHHNHHHANTTADSCLEAAPLPEELQNHNSLDSLVRAVNAFAGKKGFAVVVSGATYFTSPSDKEAIQLLSWFAEKINHKSTLSKQNAEQYTRLLKIKHGTIRCVHSGKKQEKVSTVCAQRPRRGGAQKVACTWCVNFTVTKVGGRPEVTNFVLGHRGIHLRYPFRFSFYMVQDEKSEGYRWISSKFLKTLRRRKTLDPRIRSPSFRSPIPRSSDRGGAARC